MSLFEELKRRNVFRVGIAYAISAWVLLQIVDLVLENITAPGWIMQVFMLALAIGFPIALIFAWAFEMTPEGVKLERDVDRSQSITEKTGQKLNRNISIVLGIAVVFLLVDRFWELGSGSIAPDTAQSTNISIDEQLNLTPAATPSKPEKSIAVLPFVDMSQAGDQGYFADGISEEILNVLVKTHALKVAGRTSSFQFRGQSKDLRSIGEQLGVDNILEGSIRKADNRVRITAQLVTADDGFHLWSETYDRELTDIFAIQDEIARAITDALAIELEFGGAGTPLVTASTSNMDAYDRYLEAKGLIARRLDFPRTIALLTEATELDPNFAAGWAANAQAHALTIYYSNSDRDEFLQKAELMAQKALEIDPQLSTAHSVLGDINRDRYQWLAAQQSYQRALELNPDDVEANEQYAQMLWRVRYFDQALIYSAKATRLDPLSWLNVSVNASLLYITGNRQAAWVEIERVMKMGGEQYDFPLRHAVRMAISDGDVERAKTFMLALANTHRLKNGDPQVVARYHKLISLLDSKEDTLAFLRANQLTSLTPDMYTTWQIDVIWAAYFGDYNLAEEIMDTGTDLNAQTGILDTGWLSYPVLNPLRNSESYKRLTRYINLDKYWRANGFPKNCRPLGEDDFACN